MEGVAVCICQLTGRVMTRFGSTLSNLVVNFVNVMLVILGIYFSNNIEITMGYYVKNVLSATNEHFRFFSLFFLWT